MGSIRQQKVEKVIQEELSALFQRNSQEFCLGAMVTVTIVRATSDFSLARIYLSIFAGPPKEEVFTNIKSLSGKIRKEIGQKLKSMHHIPALEFFIDDSLDYAEEIDRLLKDK